MRPLLCWVCTKNYVIATGWFAYTVKCSAMEAQGTTLHSLQKEHHKMAHVCISCVASTRLLGLETHPSLSWESHKNNLASWKNAPQLLGACVSDRRQTHGASSDKQWPNTFLKYHIAANSVELTLQIGTCESNHLRLIEMTRGWAKQRG